MNIENQLLKISDKYQVEYTKNESSWYNGSSYQPLFIYTLSFKIDEIDIKLKVEERTSFFMKANGVFPQFQDVNILEIHFQKLKDTYQNPVGKIYRKKSFFKRNESKIKINLKPTPNRYAEIEAYLKEIVFTQLDVDLNFEITDDNKFDMFMFLSFNYNNNPDLNNLIEKLFRLFILF